jgi:hypothetical protein
MTQRTSFALAAALAAAALAGCTAPLRPPSLGGLYDRSAQHHGPERNPVIVIPGILGSKLVQRDTGRVVWGAFAGGYANPQTPDGLRLVALPMREGAPLADLTDDVQPAGVLDRTRIELLGMPIELRAYAGILATLGAGGFRDELLGEAGAVDYGPGHYTCFQFDYDWRRDNVESARRLAAFIREKGEYVRRRRVEELGPSADRPVKFDIVAHSMGGLIARYYLMYGDAPLPAASEGGDGSTGERLPITWAGAEHVERAILVGTPNAGSLNALFSLVDGQTFAPILPEYPAALLGTMPSIYQLLPRGRHNVLVEKGFRVDDLLDPQLWARYGWGLTSPRADALLRQMLPDVPDAATRARIARDHQRRCLARAAAFAAALDASATPPPALSLYLFAGDAVPTRAVASVDAAGRLSDVRFAPGDGTVLRSSALMDERPGLRWSPQLVSPIAWRQVRFLFANHLGLTSDPAFSDNLLYLLLEDRRP